MLNIFWLVTSFIIMNVSTCVYADTCNNQIINNGNSYWEITYTADNGSVTFGTQGTNTGFADGKQTVPITYNNFTGSVTITDAEGVSCTYNVAEMNGCVYIEHPNAGNTGAIAVNDNGDGNITILDDYWGQNKGC